MSRPPLPHDYADNEPPPTRDPHQDLLIPDYFDNPLPSPPYRRDPSSSQVLLDTYPEQSPAYRSLVDLAHSPMPEDSHLDEKRPEPSPKGKHAVHYDDIPSPAADRFEPEPFSSRASSIAGTDDEDEESSYDWSGEEDLVDEEAKFEEAMGVKKKRRFGCVRLITLLFSTLIGSTFLSGLIITPALLLHFFWYKPHPDEHRKFVQDNVEAWLFWAAANISISWGLALIVDIIPVIIRFVISLAWGHVSEVIKSRLELYNSVKDTIKPALYAASCWVSWVILFNNIFKLYDMDDEDASRAGYTPRVYQAIEFLFFFALVVCAQRMMSHFIAFSFHRTAYKERLQGVQEALRVIEKLRVYRPKRRHAHKSSFGRTTPSGLSALLTPGHERERFLGFSRPSTPGTSRPGTPENGDSEDERDATLVQAKRKGKARTSWIPHPRAASDPSGMAAGRQDTGEHRYPPSPSPQPGRDDRERNAFAAALVLKSAVLHDARGIRGDETGEVGGDGLVWNVTSSHEAKRLARAIWMAFREPGRGYLTATDLLPAFGGKLEEAKKAFAVYKERRFLSRSMRDVGEALKTLDQMLLVLAFIILFFISLSIFGNSASNAFDAIMFLFVTHPFDTGDRCFIDDENLVVKKMGLFATIFTRSDGTETYYFNSQLFNKFITTSGGATKPQKTDDAGCMADADREARPARKCLCKWLETEENRWFQPSTSVTLQHIDYQRYLEITIGIPYNSNWQ
ncbi:hypothetical protein C2E23DRAFT_887785 [Lenzites betulinus]|nr:hypothetical protein C2E23DRAFT_887785 [Lenzites betulinus]